MGNLEKLGILVIVILVVVVGVVAITPKEQADQLQDWPEPSSLAAEEKAAPVDGAPADPAKPLDGAVADAKPLDWPYDVKPNTSADLATTTPQNSGPGMPPSANPPTTTVPAPALDYKEVKIAKGETFGIIARRELGAASRSKDIEALNPGVDSTKLKIGQVIRVPLRTAAAPRPAPADPVVVGPVVPPATPPMTPPVSAADRTYTVEPGDTLSDIARRTMGSASKVGSLKSANQDVLKGSDLIRKGMVLKIPGGTTSTAPRTTEAPPAGGTKSGDVYVVARGDTLSSIAARMLGTSSRYREIIAANEPVLHGSDKIAPGMKLTIPSDVSAR